MEGVTSWLHDRGANHSLNSSQEVEAIVVFKYRLESPQGKEDEATRMSDSGDSASAGREPADGIPVAGA